jgi:hypothetical protein
MLMGSVAEEVVRRAPCPVLTLKHPQELLAEETTEDESGTEPVAGEMSAESHPAKPRHESAQHYQG